MLNKLFSNDISKKMALAFRLGLVVAIVSMFAACESGGGKNIEAANTFVSKIRGVHAVSDAPGVDLEIDGLSFANAGGLQYGDSIPYLSREGSVSDVTVDARLPNNDALNVIPATEVALGEGQLQDVFVIGTADGSDAFDIEPYVIVRDEAFDTTQVRVTVAHLAAGVGMVDVYVTAPDADLASSMPLGSDISYPSHLDPVVVPAGDYRVRITLANTMTVVYDRALTLVAGRDWVTAAVVSPFDNDDTAGAQSPVGLLGVNKDVSVIWPSDTDGANLRVVHNASNTGAVDVLAQVGADPAATLFANVSYPNVTDYMNAAANTYQVSVNAAGTGTTAATAELALLNGGNYTVVALNTVDGDPSMLTDDVELLVLEDDVRKVVTDARVRLVHGAGEVGDVDVYVTEPMTTIDLETTKFINDFKYKDDSGYEVVAPGDYDITIARTVVIQEDPEITEVQALLGPISVSLEAGSIYTAIARDGAASGDVELILMDDFN